MLLGLLYALLPIVVAVLMIHSLFLFVQKDKSHPYRKIPFWVSVYFLVSFGFILAVPVAYADELYDKLGFNLLTRLGLGFALAAIVLFVLIVYLGKAMKTRQSYDRSM